MSNPIATHQVVGTSFGFFTADEIRKLSVKRIDNPVSLSRLLTPIEGGLYDPALGPLERDDKYVAPKSPFDSLIFLILKLKNFL